MPDAFPQNIPSDDAALMADENSSSVDPLPWHDSNGSDDDDTEDPTGKGKKKHVSSVFMWQTPKESLVKRQVRGGSFPTKCFRETRGAKNIQP